MKATELKLRSPQELPVQDDEQVVAEPSSPRIVSLLGEPLPKPLPELLLSIPDKLLSELLPAIPDKLVILASSHSAAIVEQPFCLILTQLKSRLLPLNCSGDFG